MDKVVEDHAVTPFGNAEVLLMIFTFSAWNLHFITGGTVYHRTLPIYCSLSALSFHIRYDTTTVIKRCLFSPLKMANLLTLMVYCMVPLLQWCSDTETSTAPTSAAASAAVTRETSQRRRCGIAAIFIQLIFTLAEEFVRVLGRGMQPTDGQHHRPRTPVCQAFTQRVVSRILPQRAPPPSSLAIFRCHHRQRPVWLTVSTD